MGWLLILAFVLPVHAQEESSAEAPSPTATVAATATPTATPKVVEFNPEACDDIEKVAEELIELELAGVRWQGGLSKCLDQSKFTLVHAKHVTYGDSRLLDPKITLKKGKTVKIDVPTKNAVSGIYTVKFHYIGHNGSAFKNISDSIQFSIYSKRVIKTEGCAMLLEEPATFVMREECQHE